VILDIKNKFVAGEIVYGEQINTLYDTISNGFDPDLPNMGLTTTDFALAGLTGECFASHFIETNHLAAATIPNTKWEPGAVTSPKFAQAGTTITEAKLNTSGGTDATLYPNILRVPNWTGGNTEKLILAAGYTTCSSASLNINFIFYNMLGTIPNLSSTNYLTVVMGYLNTVGTENVYYGKNKPKLTSFSVSNIAVTVDCSAYTGSANGVKLVWMIIGRVTRS